MSACGTTTGDTKLCITRGETKRRSMTWTRNADGVQVPLDAADYSAELVLKRSPTYPTSMLVLDSTESPPNGITLTTVDDSIRIMIQIGASQTADLELGQRMHWLLRVYLTADPDSDTRIFSGDLDVIDP